MATWLSNNIALTAKGRLLLSILQNASADPAVLTKVATASGRVAPANLGTQTALTQEKLPCTVLSKDAFDNGSIINVQVTNSNLLPEMGAYSVNQIGIFMRHPEIDSNTEFLYMIAQCEEGTADVMPLPQVTPVTLNYSMYLLHSQDAVIEVTIDPLNSVSHTEFDPVKATVTSLTLQMGDVQRSVGINTSSINQHNTRILALEAREDLTPRVVSLENWRGTETVKMNKAEENIASLLSRMTKAESDIEDIEDTVSGHTTTLASHTSSISDHNIRITNNTSAVNTLNTNYTNLRADVNNLLPHPTRTDNPHNVTFEQIMKNSVVSVAKGGTGASTLPAGAILLGNGTATVNFLTRAKGALYCLSSSGNPAYGTLPVSVAGTGATSLASGAILVGNGTGAISTLDKPSTSGALYALANNSPQYGVLPVNCGGTNNANLTAGVLTYDSAESKIVSLSSKAGKALYTNSENTPTWGTLPVSAGGTGNSTHIANSILVGNGNGAVKNVATKAGVLIADGDNALPYFGAMSVSAGGTGVTHIPPNSVVIGGSNSLDFVPYAEGAFFAQKDTAPKFGTLPITAGGTGNNNPIFKNPKQDYDSSSKEATHPFGTLTIGNVCIQWGECAAKGGTTKARVKFEVRYINFKYGLGVAPKNGNKIYQITDFSEEGFTVESGGAAALDDYKWIAIGFIS